MGAFRFIWWSTKIPSNRAIDEAAERESRDVRRLVLEGKLRQEEGVARGNALLSSSIPMLFVFVGVVGGFAGGLFANVVSHFIDAADPRPWIGGNVRWSVTGLVCLGLFLYVGLWADRINRLYRAMGVGAAHGAGANIE